MEAVNELLEVKYDALPQMTAVGAELPCDSRKALSNVRISGPRMPRCFGREFANDSTSE
jgi:hypothetical protein